MHRLLNRALERTEASLCMCLERWWATSRTAALWGGLTSSVHMPSVSTPSWIAGAIAETAVGDTAWSTFSIELLETIADALAAAHPELCAPAEGEATKEELLGPLNAVASNLLQEQDAKSSHGKISLPQVARLALLATRAKEKLRERGKANLKAQLRSARVARSSSTTARS